MPLLLLLFVHTSCRVTLKSEQFPFKPLALYLPNVTACNDVGHYYDIFEEQKYAWTIAGVLQII